MLRSWCTLQRLGSRNYEALRVAKHSNWSDHHKPALGLLMAARWEMLFRLGARRKKTETAPRRIDNAKDMTLPTFPSLTLHMFEAITPLKVMLRLTLTIA